MINPSAIQAKILKNPKVQSILDQNFRIIFSINFIKIYVKMNYEKSSIHQSLKVYIPLRLSNSIIISTVPSTPKKLLSIAIW